jgi:hypothetical protein
MFPGQIRIFGGVIFYAVHVVVIMHNQGNSQRWQILGPEDGGFSNVQFSGVG